MRPDRGNIVEGEPFWLVLQNAFDPSPADMAAGLRFAFDCTGDGVWEVTNSVQSQIECTIAATGTFPAKGRITDKDGGFTDYVLPLTILGPVRSDTIITDVQVQFDPATRQVTLLVTESSPMAA
jgi:hypothetical protein